MLDATDLERESAETPLTEVTEAEVTRLDAVKGPANRAPFVLLRSQTATEGAEAFLARAKYNVGEVAALGAKGQAFKGEDGKYSYPIADEEDLGNAIKAVGRGGTDHDAIRQYVAKRAKALGKADAIPDTWAADGSLTRQEGAIAGALDLPTPGAPPELEPGSPAWEAEDAAALQDAATTTAELVQLVEAVQEREVAEIANEAGDYADADALYCALQALQAALQAIAAMAFTEQVEASVQRATAQTITDAVNRLQTRLRDGADLSRKEGKPMTEETKDKETPEVELAEEKPESTDDKPAERADAEGSAAEAKTETPAKEKAEDESRAEGEQPKAEGVERTQEQPKAEDLSEIVRSAVAGAVEEGIKPLKDDLARMGDRLDKVEESPAPGGPFLNGRDKTTSGGYLVTREAEETPESVERQEAIKAETDPIKRAELGRADALEQMKDIYKS